MSYTSQLQALHRSLMADSTLGLVNRYQYTINSFDYFYGRRSIDSISEAYNAAWPSLPADKVLSLKTFPLDRIAKLKKAGWQTK